jgi:hypothetical protein
MGLYIERMLQTWQTCIECGNKIKRKELALVIENQCTECDCIDLQFYHLICVSKKIKHRGD